MYLSAQRVRSPRGATGINAYLRLHADERPWPASDPAALLAKIDDHSGRIERSIVSVKPGGNRITAYLDVVAPDHLGSRQCIDTLHSFVEMVPDLPNPAMAMDSGILLRFWTEPRRRADREEELEALAEFIGFLLLTRNGLSPGWRAERRSPPS